MRFIEKTFALDSLNLIKDCEVKTNLERWKDYGYNYVTLILNPDSNQIIHYYVSTNDNNNVGHFENLFNKINHKSDNNLCVLISLHKRVGENEIFKIINEPNTTYNFDYRDLLYESNGYLIYHHQLENWLINELKVSKLEAIRLRRSWNKKYTKEKELISKVVSFPIIKSLMPFEFVFKKQQIEKINL